MTNDFVQAWKYTGPIEAGYTNNPADRGGETKFGITASVARASGYTGPMIDLQPQQAQQIALDQFWRPQRCDELAKRSQALAIEIFDIAFNMWRGAGGLWLQRALNALNREQNDYSDIPCDGNIGDRTLEALDSYFKKRAAERQVAELVLLRMILAQRVCDYMRQALQIKTAEQFIYGWVRTRGALQSVDAQTLSV